MTFEKLNLIEPLTKALALEGYEIPTPIQTQAIPVILSGRDLLGCAQTGTGKTAAFALPILQRLYENKPDPKLKKKIRTLILTPTRELAIQIGESFAAYGKFTELKHTVIFGGVSQVSQVTALKKGIDIVIATPGRLLDLMNQHFVSLKDLEIFVLDEADRMLDMGFIHDIRKIIAVLPTVRQTLFFSATMPTDIRNLTKTILTNPEKIEVTPASTTAETVVQSLYFVEKGNKKQLLVHLLNTKEIDSALVFTRTKHGADVIARALVNAQISAEAIHGNKSQNARQKALSNFKTKKTRVLVATDIAARGIDVDNLSHVINFDMPNIAETYVHRIGRTGRAGLSGEAFSFCADEEMPYLQDIKKLLNMAIPIINDHPYPMTVFEQVAKPQPKATSFSTPRVDRKWRGR